MSEASSIEYPALSVAVEGVDLVRWQAWAATALIVAATVYALLATSAPLADTDAPVAVPAPVEGVVERVLVPSGASVKAGEPLVKLDDASLRQRVAAARQEASRAGVLRAQIHAGDPQAPLELALAQAGEALALARLDLAEAMRDAAVLRAPVDGIVIHGGAPSTDGKALSAGQAIVHVAAAGNALD